MSASDPPPIRLAHRLDGAGAATDPPEIGDRDRVACVDGPPDARGNMSSLTGGSTAITCPASHEGVLVKPFHSEILQRPEYCDVVRLSKAELSSLAGCSLPTSHPAVRGPHHCPAFGTGELQEGGTTL